MKCFRVAVLTALVVAALTGCVSRQAQQNPLPLAAPDAAQQDSTSYRSIYSFGANTRIDGQQPKAGLTDVDGTLYGTTYVGGKDGDGTVFSMTTGGVETVLHSFRGNYKGGDGKNPSASMIAENGLLYGTTEYGGTGGQYGTVFRISTSGAEKVLYRFQGYFYGHDGANPVASLIEVDRKLYGTTSNGGDSSLCSDGCGTVFRISTSGKEKILHSFESYSDGQYPLANLIHVNGALYGTTEAGGADFAYKGYGTVFSISTAGTENVIYDFYSGYSADGGIPKAGLLNFKGTLYGTASSNGPYSGGTAFSITTSGYVKNVHSFGSGSDGSVPVAPLLSQRGALYGTTSEGGAYGKGTIFKLSLDGSKEKVLHSFGYGADGATPLAGLIDVDGTLYGTTSAGGTYGFGTVFALKLPR